MPILPPSKNQPVDYKTIVDLVDTVNRLEQKVNLSSGKSALGTTITRTSDIVFVANNVLVSKKSVAVDEVLTGTWSIAKDVAFKNPPTVTATIVSDSSNASLVGNSAIVTISKVSVSTVEYRIHFTKSGNANFSLNLIAVGLSSLDKLNA